MEPPPLAGIFDSNFLFFIIALACCALFSFIETSITAVRLFKLKEIANGTSKYRGLFQVFETSPNRILISVLIAYNLSNTLAPIFAAEVTASISKALNISERVGFVIGILIASTTILLTDLIPKNIAAIHGERFFSSTLWITNIIYKLFQVPVSVLSKFADVVTHWIAGSSEKDTADAFATEKEIQYLLSYINEKGLMERHKVNMLRSIFELGTTPIKEVMVAEPSIISINVTSSQKDALELFSKYQYTRMPVYEDKSDNIIGMLHQKDFFLLLSKGEDRPIRDIVRPIMFFPESAKVLRVLRDFREQRMHMAMVLNEFGVVTGLVTLEDVIEEIVGEISDEYEAVPEKVILLKSGGYLVDASISLDELGTLLGIEFEAEDAVSLGGFLIEQLERVPQTGERLAYKSYHFKVQQATPKRILQVLIFAHDFQEEPEVEV